MKETKQHVKRRRINNEYKNIKKLIEKAEENINIVNNKYKYAATDVDDKLINAIEYIIQALKGLKELEDD